VDSQLVPLQAGSKQVNLALKGVNLIIRSGWVGEWFRCKRDQSK